MVGLFILDGRGRLRWRQFALFGGVASIGIFLVLLVWSNLPSMNWNKPTEVFWQWLENNSNYQAYLSERGSGWIQALKDQLGEQWLLLIIIGYGVVQPVLPGTMIEPAPLLVQIINTLRALGWYALAPFLIYSGIAALRRGEQAHRAARLWLTATILLWVLIAAANAGGDQWDNPRYRTMLLAWEALLAAWGLWWGLARRDAWLWRWLAFEGACVLIFMDWYISRYHPGTVVNLGLWGTAALTLAAGALIFGGGLFWDWRKKRARK
jgi:hypothetical protein